MRSKIRRMKWKRKCKEKKRFKTKAREIYDSTIYQRFFVYEEIKLMQKLMV